MLHGVVHGVVVKPVNKECTIDDPAVWSGSHHLGFSLFFVELIGGKVHVRYFQSMSNIFIVVLRRMRAVITRTLFTIMEKVMKYNLVESVVHAQRHDDSL
jgi:hypothetical protein